MPYASDAQRRFMHARHPDIAARWDAEIRRKKGKRKMNRKNSANIVLCLSNGEYAAVDKSDKKPLEFWKEVARVGKFQKGDFKFAITERAIDHWCRTHQERSQRGIECPFPVEHTKNPEARRGTVLALAKGQNSKGQTAMFARIKFRDEEAAKLVHSGVSIFVPHEDQDGYGNTYRAPVQHICATDYPVIAGLEPYQPIACSFDTMELAFPPQPDKTASEKQDAKNASTTPSAGQNGKSPNAAPNDPGVQRPKPGDQGQATQRVTLRDVANTLGIDPQITDEAQLLLAIQQTIMAMRMGAHAQQAPQAPQFRPPMAPGAPAGPSGGPMGPQMPAPGVAPMMPKPQVFQQRPPIAMSRTKKNRKARNKMLADVAFSLDDLPESILMALSKKQMKKLVKTIKRGKKAKKPSINKGLDSVEFNEESHFGQEDPGGSDEDDTYKDEDNDAFYNGCDNDEDEDTFSGKAKAGPSGLALSGSVLDMVRENRQTKIDLLLRDRLITPAVKKRLEERFVRGQGVAFSHEYDDGFDELVKDYRANGRVLNQGVSGPQVEASALALSNGAEGSRSALQQDAERRANGKPNFLS